MANGLLELLSATEWVPAHATEQAYAAGTAEATPAKAAAYTPWRFVRIQAHDGDLLVNFGAAAPASGAVRVFQGTAEVFQLPRGGDTQTLNLAAVSGTVHGAVVWGR